MLASWQDLMSPGQLWGLRGGWKCGGRGRGLRGKRVLAIGPTLWGGASPEPRIHPGLAGHPPPWVFTGCVLNQNTFFVDTFLEDKLEEFR